MTNREDQNMPPEYVYQIAFREFSQLTEADLVDTSREEFIENFINEYLDNDDHTAIVEEAFDQATRTLRETI